jgi:hypothetical protein
MTDLFIEAALTIGVVIGAGLIAAVLLCLSGMWWQRHHRTVITDTTQPYHYKAPGFEGLTGDLNSALRGERKVSS